MTFLPFVKMVEKIVTTGINLQYHEQFGCIVLFTFRFIRSYGEIFGPLVFYVIIFGNFLFEI